MTAIEIIRENELSTDGRFIQADATEWPEKIPVIRGHEVTGVIDKIWREDGSIYVEWESDTDYLTAEARGLVIDQGDVLGSMTINQMTLMSVVCNETERFPWKDRKTR